MDIVRPNKHTFSIVSEFLKPYESKCVLLSSYVRRQSEKIYVIVDGCYIGSVDDILGVLYIDSTLFHCIPDTLALDSMAVLKFFMKLTENGGKKIKCISGEAVGTDYFLNLMKVKEKNAYQVNNYRLMTSSGFGGFRPEALCDGDELIRCTENEIEELFALQQKYLKEEVAPKGKVISRLEVSMSLRQILKNQLCLAIFSDGEAVAKANTNAIGINWIQIGGVYTHPLFRRNGYAVHLIYSICRRAFRVNRNVALFVKEKNEPAIQLYKKLGFQAHDLYKIAYFN